MRHLFTRRTLLAVALTIATASGCARTTEPLSAPAPIDLAWLAGTWRAESDGRVTVERWAIDGDALRGTNETRVGDERVHSEVLSIVVEEGVTVYRAAPSGQAAHAFPLSESGRGLAVFSDPGHDWPQHIQYEREGARLTAKVWGDTGDDQRLEVWEFVRVGDP